MALCSAPHNFLQILAITNKAPANIHVQFCMDVVFIFLDKYSGERLLVAMVNACVVFKETSKLYYFMFPQK